MTVEQRIARIMRSGLYVGIVFMLAGIIVTFSGHYNGAIRLSYDNILSGKLLMDGAGLLYIGTLFLIATPVAVLAFLSQHYLRSSTKKYGLYCIMLLIVLLITVMLKV